MFRLLAREIATQRIQLLLELLIITLGLLIALGIDNVTEWRSHQALASSQSQAGMPRRRGTGISGCQFPVGFATVMSQTCREQHTRIAQLRSNT